MSFVELMEKFPLGGTMIKDGRIYAWSPPKPMTDQEFIELIASIPSSGKPVLPSEMCDIYPVRIESGQINSVVVHQRKSKRARRG